MRQSWDGAEHRQREDTQGRAYQYRKGFLDGYQAALSVVARGDFAGVPLNEVMGGANRHKTALIQWRDSNSRADSPPRAVWIDGFLISEKAQHAEGNTPRTWESTNDDSHDTAG